MISIDQSNYFATKSITYVYKIDFTFETTSIILENLNSKSAFLSAKKSWFLQTKVNLKKSIFGPFYQLRRLKFCENDALESTLF